MQRFWEKLLIEARSGDLGAIGDYANGCKVVWLGRPDSTVVISVSISISISISKWVGPESPLENYRPINPYSNPGTRI